MAKELLSGNEAIARGAWEAGVKLAAAYPGTPSTEILENLAKYEGVYSEWSPNEKVAMEVAIGASMAGAARSGGHEARGPQRGRRPVLLRRPTSASRPAWWWSPPTTRACTAPRTSRTTATTPSSPRCRCSSPSDSRRGQGLHGHGATSCPSSSTPRCCSAPPRAPRTPRAWSSWASAWRPRRCSS